MSAWEELKSGDYAKAVTGFSEEIRVSPSTPAYNNRGMAYLHLGDFDAALADFRSADALSSAALNTVCDGSMLKYGVGRAAGYAFVGITIVAYTVVHLFYRHRLARLRDDIAEMTEQERSRCFQEIDPEIADDLKKKDEKTDG